MLTKKKTLFYFFTIFVIVALWSLPAMAGYYDGKTITVIMGGHPGSGLDLNCRFVVENWEKHFPGKTQMIVKNMPGAGGVKGLNFLYEKARPDGLTIFNGNWNPTGVLAGQPGIRYKPEELNWIGSAYGYFLTLVRSDVAASPEDILQAKNLKVGGINPSLVIDVISRVSLDMLGVDYKYVPGYGGMPKIKAALLASEVNMTTTGYAGYRNFFKDTSLKSGELIMAFSHPPFDEAGNPERSDKFPGAKPFVEIYETVHGKKPSGPLFEIYRYLPNIRFRTTNSLIAPPGIPKEALEELRETFKATYEDTAFQKLWIKQYGEKFDWLGGQKVESLVKTYKQISPEAIALLKKYKRFE